MRRWWTAAALGLGWAICGAACSGSTTGREPFADIEVSECTEVPHYSACSRLPVPGIDELCAQGMDVLCRKYHECGSLPSNALDACRTHFRAVCERDFESLSRAGTYDADAAACCFQHWADSPCGMGTGSKDPICRAIGDRRGTQLVGAHCGGTQDCIRSAYCDAKGVEGGTCVTYAPEGGECADAGRCRDSDICIDGICTALGCTGAPCGPPYDSCAQGLVCVEEGSTGTCRKPAALGDPCSVSRACDQRFGCDFSDYPTSGTCAERAGAGGPCWRDENCTADYFCEGADLETETRGRCEAVPDLGTACEPASGVGALDPCRSKLGLVRCQASTNTCEPDP